MFTTIESGARDNGSNSEPSLVLPAGVSGPDKSLAAPRPRLCARAAIFVHDPASDATEHQSK
jgi:hypothetical protein